MFISMSLGDTADPDTFKFLFTDGFPSYFGPLIFHRWSPTSPILISEVMFDPSGNEPGSEWIEIYNHSINAVKLSDYLLGDSETPGDMEGMYVFPPGSILLPGEAVVVAVQSVEFEVQYGFKPDFELKNSDTEVPDLLNDRTWASGSLSLNNSGDEILLLSLSYSQIDLVSWGNSAYAFTPPVHLVPQGHSIERYPAYKDTNSSEDWRDQAIPSPGMVDLTPPPTQTPMPATFTPSPTVSNTATATKSLTPTQTSTSTPTRTQAPSNHVLLSEVMINPLDLDPINEWIEIYNPLTDGIDLTDYKIGDEESMGGGEGMLQFPSGTHISAEQTIVIVHNAEYFYSMYGFMPDFEMEDSDPNVPDMLIYSAWADGIINLGNSGDEVLILGRDDNLIDALSWGLSKWAFDPPCPAVSEGQSLERYPADVDTDTAADWRVQEFPNP